MESLEKHNKLIESINNDIDNLLNEYSSGNALSDIWTLFRHGPPGFITKKIIHKLVGDDEDEKENLKDEKKDLEKKKKKAKDVKEKEKIQKDIDDLSKSIKDISKRIRALNKVEKKALPFKKIEIKFKKKISLDIKKLNSPEYKRNLVGSMYFTVDGLNEKLRFIDLKTKSFPTSLITRLYYKDINSMGDQHGKVQLIYNQYGSTTDKGSISGEEKGVDFKILKTQ